jgi:hypothetical protein
MKRPLRIAAIRAKREYAAQPQLGLIAAGVTLVVVIVSFVCTYAVCRWYGARTDAAIMAAILALGLARRHTGPSPLRMVAAPIVIAGIALGATGVGWMFRTNLWLGALVFTLALSASVWLRNFGQIAQTAGALLALPLVAILVVPVRPSAPGGPFVDFALVVCAGVIPLVCVTLIWWMARRAGIALAPPEHGATKPAARKGAIPVPTRMAIQMAAALAAAFVTGFLLFPGHWGWSVLTAFIVCSGARGRGDAAYKGVLRLAGAVSGTLAAALTTIWAPTGVAEAVTIFTALFFGIWLREVNYAYWAACVTLILALLAGPGDGPHLAFLGLRIEAILVGAVCAVAAAWFVLPIRTEAVVRRRIADALVALDDLAAQADLSSAEHTQRLARFEHRVAELDKVAPPVRWHRRIFTFADRPEHPARWIEATCGLRDHARAVHSAGWRGDAHRAAVRRAIGASRRAIANAGKPDAASDALSVSASLRRVHDALTYM